MRLHGDRGSATILARSLCFVGLFSPFPPAFVGSPELSINSPARADPVPWSGDPTPRRPRGLAPLASPGRRDGATLSRGKASMLNFNINLTSLAIILWSGMLIIAGSIWVLSSQVRKVADLLEDQGRETSATQLVESPYEARLAATSTRIARRGASGSLRSTGRTSLAGARSQGQLATLRREASVLSRAIASQVPDDRSAS